MPSKWIGCIHKGQVGKRWSLKEKAYRYDSEDKLSNAGRREYNMQFHVEFSTESTEADWRSFVPRVRLPSVSTRAR